MTPDQQAIERTVVPKERPSEGAWLSHFTAPQGHKAPLPDTNDEVLTKYYLREEKEHSGAYADDDEEDHQERTFDPHEDSIESFAHRRLGGHSTY